MVDASVRLDAAEDDRVAGSKSGHDFRNRGHREAGLRMRRHAELLQLQFRNGLPQALRILLGGENRNLENFSGLHDPVRVAHDFREEGNVRPELFLHVADQDGHALRPRWTTKRGFSETGYFSSSTPADN